MAVMGKMNRINRIPNPGEHINDGKSVFKILKSRKKRK